jgi:hypothetical protein
MATEKQLRSKLAEICKQLHGSQAFYQVLIDAMILHSTKNQDYAADDDPFRNFRESADFAGISVPQALDLHRGNKRSRERNLRDAKSINHESLNDTRFDDLIYTALRLAFDEDAS